MQAGLLGERAGAQPHPVVVDVLVLADREAACWCGVRSRGGPLIVVPESSVNAWGGCAEDGFVLGDADGCDDYGRACGVGGWAGVIAVGVAAATALVLVDEPAKRASLPKESLSFFELATDRVIATERASVSNGRLQHPVPAAW
ncbi:Imm21 family immunity protein [Streptomyces sp. MJM1172]|uniref:Imm21 family immunity protein n=1 Tax=Streptomyces sp. MJM1172 TaxID=1703926 RepID=UPI0009A17B7D